LDLASHHPNTLRKVQELDANKQAAAKEGNEATASSPPVFVQHLADVRVTEGDAVRLECAVEPVNDSSLQLGMPI